MQVETLCKADIKSAKSSFINYGQVKQQWELVVWRDGDVKAYFSAELEEVLCNHVHKQNA